MAEKSVAGPFPITLTVDGSDYCIPLSDLFFQADGTLSASNWPPYAAAPAGGDLTKSVDAALAQAKKDLILTPGQGISKPAFVATAKYGGDWVSVTILISDITINAAHPEQSTASFAVTETETYNGLTVASIAGLLGTTVPAPGTQPGLLLISSDPGKIAMPGGATTASAGAPPKAVIQQADGATTAFELTSQGTEQLSVTITVDPKDASKFDLVSTWSKTANVQVKQLGATFKDVITVAPPPGPGGYQAPAAGLFTLSGATDPVLATAATPSSATVSTDPTV